MKGEKVEHYYNYWEIRCSVEKPLIFSRPLFQCFAWNLFLFHRDWKEQPCTIIIYRHFGRSSIISTRHSFDVLSNHFPLVFDQILHNLFHNLVIFLPYFIFFTTLFNLLFVKCCSLTMSFNISSNFGLHFFNIVQLHFFFHIFVSFLRMFKYWHCRF